MTALLAVTLVLSGLLLSRTQGPSVTRAALSSAPTAPAPQDAVPAPEPKGPRPVVRTKQTVVPTAPAGSANNVVAELPKTRTTAYGMVGVTWSADTTETDVSVAIRSLVKGEWTPWETLENDDAAPGDGGRPGTEPVWVGKAEGVAVRVSSGSGTRPADIKVLTIDPGGVDEAPAATVTGAAYKPDGVVDGMAHATTAAAVDGTPTYTPRPTIIMRKAWGATAGSSCSAPLTGSSTRGIVVHHTAGSNTYSMPDSAKIVRGIQAYHTKGHGWCDIGYNFLVDKYGQIFEGRKGGIDRQVRAAHSGNGEVNTYATGISMMGDYDKIAPQAALKTAMVKLVGWRMGTTFMKAKGTWKVSEKKLTLNLIAGHRNVVGTACPGKHAYAWLSESGGLRDRVETYIAKYDSPIKRRFATLGTSVTGPVFVGETETEGGRKVRLGKADLYSKTGFGTRLVTEANGFRAKYQTLEAQRSELGFPKSDSPTGTTGTTVQRFEHGSMYAMHSGSKVSLHALWGPIATAYKKLGEAGSKLGVPTTSVHSESGGFIAKFANGTIRYVTATKKTTAYDKSGKVLSTAAAVPSSDSLKVPDSRKFTLTGHGYGHGIGMGQYGAQNAAKKGLTWGAILRYYYPGTAGAKIDGAVRVLLSADTSVSVVVKPAPGLGFRNVETGKLVTLPTTVTRGDVIQWRISPVSGNAKKSVLQYRWSGGWRNYKTVEWTGNGQFEAPGPIKLILPSGSATYRGALRSAPPSKGSATRDTVNVLPIEDYLRGVVAAEMPSSWHASALKAQAVAARTYMARGLTPSRHYDLCDTTSCQVYRGTSVETKATDSAVSGTAGRILHFEGKPAFTQFSSSSGGYSAAGSAPYLKQKIDEYDDWSGNANHSWTKTVSASTLEKKYSSIGTLKSLEITKRSGAGDWGGRVTTLVLTGSDGTKSISGADARTVLGLKSTWFRF